MFSLFAQFGETADPNRFQLTPFNPVEEDYVAFGLISVLLVLLSVAVLYLVRRMDFRLIMIGLLVAIAAIGYGSLIPSAGWTAPTLMRIAVIMILCGAAYALLNYPAAGTLESRVIDPVARPINPIPAERTGDVLP